MAAIAIRNFCGWSSSAAEPAMPIVTVTAFRRWLGNSLNRRLDKREAKLVEVTMLALSELKSSHLEGGGGNRSSCGGEVPVTGMISHQTCIRVLFDAELSGLALLFKVDRHRAVGWRLANGILSHRDEEVGIVKLYLADGGEVCAAKTVPIAIILFRD